MEMPRNCEEQIDFCEVYRASNTQRKIVNLLLKKNGFGNNSA
ncbi:1631_t:CDS:2 [Gigaspora rosea]|nr:1631_t:CDS:2 [Gigaspora rosea]